MRSLIVVVALAAVPALAQNPLRPVAVDARGITFVGPGGATVLKRWGEPGTEESVLPGAPPSYHLGRKAQADLELPEALTHYAAALKAAKGSFWLAQFVRYRRAECLLWSGKRKDARTELALLTKTYPRGRFALSAWWYLGRLERKRASYAEARAAFGQLVSVATWAESGRDGLRGRVGLASIDRLEGKHEAALRAYRAAARDAARRMRDLWCDARVGEGRTLLAMKQTADARPVFVAVVEEDAASEAQLAAAYNGLGRCDHAAGKHAEALRSFLKVVTLFDDEQSEMPEALWHASDCMRRMGGGEVMQRRARALRARLRESYPHSAWAKK